MFFITGMSTFTWVLIIYIGLNLGDDIMLPLFKSFFDKGHNVTNILHFPVLIHTFPAGHKFTVYIKELFLIVGSLALFIEIAKAATANKFGASETLLSFIVSMIFIVMFFMVSWAQNATFLILAMMSLIDATGGFIIELNAARRDVNIVGGGGILG
ncbi:MAG: Unknown protein [uncultured Sulfurovum sp.]|uniref:Uncharacterized protein n=1 Tax=uncultured Sulfurovum sp. TaxID=269237 RepID=A0A6S6SR25_9BACT|nr:MAG: Unknown protein [uncultured Sulfurovum sp.]